MNKSTRPLSLANPSFLPAALAAAMLIASPRSASAEPASAAETERAARVFSATGIRGGVMVHLGATDGKFTAALKANEHCCVQGLTTDPAACDAGAKDGAVPEAKRGAKKQNASAKKESTAAKKRANLLNQAAAATPSKRMWQSPIPLTGKAIAMSENGVFVAGTPVAFPEGDIAKAYEGRMGGVLWLADATTGEKLAAYPLPAPPAWDSLAVANGSVYIALTDGRLLCFAGK